MKLKANLSFAARAAQRDKIRMNNAKACPNRLRDFHRSRRQEHADNRQKREVNA